MPDFLLGLVHPLLMPRISDAQDPDSYWPANSGGRFCRNAWRASSVSWDPPRILPALEVNVMVVSSELSKAVRITRLLIRPTSGGEQ